MDNELTRYVVRVTKTAETDLHEIITYIADSSPDNASKILAKLETKILSLNHQPNRGGYVPELLKHNIKEYRQLLENPWRIIYKIDNLQAIVLTVIDTRRNLQDILWEKLINAGDKYRDGFLLSQE